MPGSPILSFGPYQLDFEKVQLWCDTQPVRLTPKAFQVLCYLIERPGQLVTKDELFRVVWVDTVVGDAALTMCIQEIRKALGDTPKSPQYVETVHRLGFRFIAPVATSAAQPVSSSKFQVPSQEERGSSQEPEFRSQNLEVRIQEEESQKGNGENTEQAEGMMREALEPPPSSPSRLEPEAYSLPQDFALPTPSTQHPAPNVQHSPSSRFTRSFVLAAVLLLTATILTVQYLSRPSLSTQSSALVTQEAQLPLPDKPSIVVLPLVNLSTDPEQEYFSDGLTEDIITNLSRIENLFVIDRQSAFFYKGKAVKISDIARELGVRYVLEGSVRKAENRVRISVRLVETSTGEHRWDERYERPLADIFTLQDEITQKIVTTLNLQFTTQELGSPIRKRTTKVEAYDALLRGVERYRRYTATTNLQARQFFEQAIALDPQYVQAYECLGNTYFLEWDSHWSADPQGLDHAIELAQQALAVDESYAAAHARLAMFSARKGQIERALSEIQQAVLLDPNSADIRMTQAEMFNFAGRPEDALEAAQLAIRRNPYAPAYYQLDLGYIYLLLDRYAESIAALKQALARNLILSAYPLLANDYILQWVGQLSPDPQLLTQAYAAAQHAVTLNDAHPYAHLVLGLTYLNQKQYDLAIAEFERVVSLDATSGCGLMLLAFSLSRVGKIDEAVLMSEKGLRLETRFDRCAIAVGGTYTLAGKFEEARTVLQRLLQRAPNFLPGHLELATVYSELGQEAEAREEAAEVLRLNPHFSLEVHKQRTPIKDPAVLERQIAALRKAGLK